MNKKYLLQGVLILLLFIIVSSFVQQNIDTIKDFINRDAGMLTYVLIVTIAVIIAPVSATPMIPIASNVWGWWVGGILSFIGWMVGSIIAFTVARKFGIKIIGKFASTQSIVKIQAKIPSDNVFWSLVFLRTIIPVDLLSYAAGLFSKISYRQYLLATVLGLIPFAFLFSYLGSIPVFYQIITFTLGGIIIGFIIYNYVLRDSPIKVSQNKP